MPPTWLGAAAGAHQGFMEQLKLDQAAAQQQAALKLQQDRLAQDQSQFNADLDFRYDNLGVQAGQRNSTRLVERAQMRPPGSMVSPGEMQEEVGAGMPSQIYPNGEEIPTGGLDDADQPQTVTGISYAGTFDQQHKQAQEARLSAQDMGGSEGADWQPVDLDINGVRTPGRQNRQTLETFVMQNGQKVPVPNPKRFVMPDRVWMDYQGPNGENVRGPRAGMGNQPVGAPLVGGQRAEVDAMDDMLREIENVQSKYPTGTTSLPGVGPVQSKIGRLTEATGINPMGIDSKEGRDLRTALNRMKSTAAFATGGKTLTPTEQAALNRFLAADDIDDMAILQRLEEMRKAFSGRRSGIGTQTQAPPNQPQQEQILDWDPTTKSFKPGR